MSIASNFDPQAATQAYIDTLTASELALSRSYTAGNHWLILAGLAVSALVTWLIVRSGILDKVYSKLEKRGWALRTYLVAAVFLLVDSLITLPYSIYTEWWRESQFGRTSQPLADYLVQGTISIVLSAILAGIFVLGLYWLIRKAGRLWWIWGGALSALAIVFMLLVSPTVLMPIFNDFDPLPQGEVRDALVPMAEEAGIPADRIFVYDGSRQSENFAANVAGVGPSKRIAISDVALGDASLDEVKAVTGHEIGHFALGHSWRAVFVYGLLGLIGLFVTARFYPVFARLFGSETSVDDIRGVPVLAFLMGLVGTLATPVTSSLTRIGEEEADAYSLETVGLPDAMAGALIKTAEYRYPLAGPVEETLLYSHPTVENRIRRAMEWKAENLTGESSGSD